MRRSRSMVKLTLADRFVQSDGGDLADAVAVDLHVVAGHDPGGVGEEGVVVAALRPERQIGVAERHQHQADHQHDAEDAGAQRISFSGRGLIV